MTPILIITCAGHQLMLDEKDGFYRVCCNGGIYATFNSQTLGVLEALKQAVAHAGAMEKKCYENPKTK